MATVLIAYEIPDPLFKLLNIGKYHEIWMDTDTAEGLLKESVDLSNWQREEREKTAAKGEELVKSMRKNKEGGL